MVCATTSGDLIVKSLVLHKKNYAQIFPVEKKPSQVSGAFACKKKSQDDSFSL